MHAQRILYTVTAQFTDPAAASAYIAWLEDGHIDAVVSHGAHSAMMVRLDPDPPSGPIRIQTQYVFPTRQEFDHYVEHHAPSLREDGLKRFGPGTPHAAVFTRSIGVIL